MTLTVRPLQPEDVEAAARVQIAAFSALDAGAGRPVPPVEELLPRASARVAHLQATDPDGALVADLDGRIAGVALALRREDVWFLSLLVVDPELQSRGTGALLLERALASADGTRGQYLCSSSDPRALARYGRAGFALGPGVEVSGTLDRSVLPRVEGVREGDWERDGERVEERARAARGAGYGPDLDMLRTGRLLVAEGGVAVVRPGTVTMVSAADQATATQLLWAGIAEAGEEVEVAEVTAANPWAVRVLVDSRLPLSLGGGVAVRGDVGPLAPHLPSGAYG